MNSSDKSEQERAQGLNFLAETVDAQGRITEAFEAYNESNRKMQLLFRGWFAGMETGLAFSRRVRSALEAMPDLKSAGETKTPIFLIGFARAGTTLIGQILASHPSFVTLEEKPLLVDGMRQFFTPKDGLARLANLNDAECENFRTLYWQRARAHGGDHGKLVVDQTPLNTLHLALIARLFPGARVIFALRDPRDVVLSCFRRLFVPNAYTREFLSLENTAHFYDATMDCAQLARAKLNLCFHDIRNEDLVADFESEMRRLCLFLGVDLDPAMAGFAERSKTRAVATPSSTQVAKGLNSDGIGHWRRYQDQLRPILPLLARWVDRFGYPSQL